MVRIKKLFSLSLLFSLIAAFSLSAMELTEHGLVTFAGHGTTFVISLLAGPAQPALWATLSKMAAIPIHSAACAAGIALGVATGPV